MPRQGLTSEVVVDAAARFADDFGYDALSLSAIADRVLVRTPSLYKHVASLDDLRSRLAVRAYTEIGVLLEAAVTDAADPLTALARAYRRFALERPGLATAAVRAPDSSDDALLAAASLATEPLFTVVRHFGVTDPDDLVHQARTLRSALHGFVSLERSGGFGLAQDIDSSFDRMITSLGIALHAAGSPSNQLASPDRSSASDSVT